MTTPGPFPEAASIGELIEDCTDMPAALRAEPARLVSPRAVPDWEVTDACQAQVHGLDVYI